MGLRQWAFLLCFNRVGCLQVVSWVKALLFAGFGVQGLSRLVLFGSATPTYH